MENFSLVDFFKLKDKFIKYVAEKEPEENKVEKEIDVEENFFRYASEFEKFAAKELKLTENSFSENFDKLNSIENVTELLELINQEEEALNNTSLEDVEHAEAEEPQATAEEETAVNEDVSTAEGEESENTQEETEANLLNATIVEMFKNEEFKNLVDTNSDGKIDEEELLAMFNSAIGLDDNKENLSLNDLTQAMTKVNEGEFKIESTSSKEKNIAPVQTPTTPVRTQNTKRTNNPNRYISLRNNGLRNQSYKPITNIPEPTKEEMLQQAIVDQQAVVNKERAEVAEIENGANNELNTLKTEADNCYQAYMTKLEAADSSKAQKLQELNLKKDCIDKNNASIDMQKNIISEYNGSISNIDSSIACLTGKQSELKNAQTEENEKIIQLQLNKLSQELKQLNESKKALLESKKQAEEEIKRLETENTALQGEEKTIEEQIKELEEEISQIKNEDLQNAKTAYETAKENYEIKKNEILTAAKADVENAIAVLNEHKKKLTEYNNEQAEKKYTPTGITEQVNTAVLAAISEESLNLVYEANGENSGECEKFGVGSGKNAPWCAGFVAWLYEKNGEDNPYDFKKANSESGNRTYNRNAVSSYENYGIDKGYFSEYGNYTPVPGDVMIQKSHTGLVIGVENDIVYVVEGNTSDDVAIRAYTLGLNSHETIEGWVRTNEMCGGTSEIPGDYYLTDDVRKRLPNKTNEKRNTKIV